MMKWLMFAVALLAAVCLSLPTADAQGCQNGQCFAGPPVMAGAYFGGPVILRPVPDPMFSPVMHPAPAPQIVFIGQPATAASHSPESPHPGHHSPPIVLACGSGQCQPQPVEYGHAWQRQRTCGVGINLTWHRSGGNAYQSRWR